MTFGIPLGDPGGIGPEVVLKALVAESWTSGLIIGPHAVASHPALRPWVEQLDLYFVSESDLDPSLFKKKLVWVEPACSFKSFDPGLVSSQNGTWAYHSLKLGAELALKGLLEGLVTAPLSKTALSHLDLPAFDHTTLLKLFTQVPSTRMAFYTDRLKTVLHTTHIPLRMVWESLTPESLFHTFTHTATWMRHLGISAPKIALAGLNPHAGEGGLMGTEETEILCPILDQWNTSSTPSILGPFPPDTVFMRMHRGEFDCVISLYHDQGLIPLKLMHFEDAVNTTLGLPFIRTSPDHGTAFDIAYQGKAAPDSLISALRLAQKCLIN
jgi:4-hydroxythreonine-4-phosphate dehydrogenase